MHSSSKEKQARSSIQLYLLISCLYLHFKAAVWCPSALVLSTTTQRNSDSRCQFISFSSLYLSCLPLLAEGFDHYLPSSEFLFSVWEWFLQHTASLIYLKYSERSVHAQERIESLGSASCPWYSKQLVKISWGKEKKCRTDICYIRLEKPYNLTISKVSTCFLLLFPSTSYWSRTLGTG